MADKVIVIGGGLAGLASAIRLAGLGLQVKLFEKNASAGGKMNRWMDGEFRYDTGPSLLTMPFVIDDLFGFVGEKRESYLNFMPVEPVCKYFWDDGVFLSASMDAKVMHQEISALSKADASNYNRFIGYSKRIYDLSADIFLYNPIHEMRSILKPSLLRRFLLIHRIDPFRTVDRGIRRFFSDERIIQIFNRYATYNGSDPFQAPATLNIIPFVEYVLGGYYIRGGMYKLVEALLSLALGMGVEINTNAEVKQIMYNASGVKGVIVNDESVSADRIVCNADVVTAHSDLIPDQPRLRRRYAQLEPSLSGLVFMWSVRGRHEQLQHHNILFSNNYRREFQQLFVDRDSPDDPTVYISISAKSDPDQAPAGCENWFVLVNMPYLSEGQDWDQIIHKTRNMIIQKLLRQGIDLSGKIGSEKIITPIDFKSLYGSNRGSIYGVSSNSRSSAFRRPGNRSKKIKGLYFAGGSTHPGGGIPLVLLSAKIVTDLIKRDMKL